MGLRLIPVIHGDVGKLCGTDGHLEFVPLESTQSINTGWELSVPALQQQHPHTAVPMASGTGRGRARAPTVALQGELSGVSRRSRAPIPLPVTPEGRDRTFLSVNDGVSQNSSD